ncbi:MAG: hypothetical protein C4519_08200 [Desulfobacteraceae bacterium]|nr:MAG: hypothetical protein C4519_08200 [Desulfobacteraceae bacterium]
MRSHEAAHGRFTSKETASLITGDVICFFRVSCLFCGPFLVIFTTGSAETPSGSMVKKALRFAEASFWT